MTVSNERPQSTARKPLPSSQTCHAMPHKYPCTKQNAWIEPIPLIPNTEPLPGFTTLSQRGNKSTSNFDSPSADTIAVQLPFHTCN